MMELPHIPNPFKRKKEMDISDEMLLDEIEKETNAPKTQGKILPPPPALQRPVGHIQLPSTPTMQQPEIAETKMMDTQTVAKLPLFMRVEEYDKILAEVNRVAESLKTMGDILDTLTKLEEEQTDQTKKWRGQLEITKTQVKQLVAHLPETGKLKEMIQIKKQQQQREILKKDIASLGDELKRTTKQPSREIENMQSELSSIKAGMQSDMQKLQEQVKIIAEMVKQTAQQKKAAEFPKQEYKKTDEKKPW